MERFLVAHPATPANQSQTVHVAAEPLLQPAAQVICLVDASRAGTPLCLMETQEGGGFLLSARLTDVAMAFVKLGLPACLMTARLGQKTNKARPMLVMPNHFHAPEETAPGLICLPYKPHEAFQRLIERELPFYESEKNPLSLFIAATQHQVEYGIQRAKLRAHNTNTRHKSIWQAVVLSPSARKEPTASL